MHALACQWVSTCALYVAGLQDTEWLVCRQAISSLLTRGQGRQALRPERSGQARCLRRAALLASHRRLCRLHRRQYRVSTATHILAAVSP
jgi:hypothetical protein